MDENITNCDQLFYSSALETFDVEVKLRAKFL